MNRLNINKILSLAIGGIVIFIIAVSAIALCTKNAHPGEGLRHEDPLPESVGKSKSAFNEIGQIRVFTREDEKSKKSVIILVPWLEYDGNDQAFYEELDRKHLSIKNLLTTYFATRTKEELLNLGESKIKSELKEQVNETLVLGKITSVYFNDYLFLD
ncbi:MAG: flagellar basal body-associated FliL family protein [Treponema sp.]|nr:flagellar basal body-associated FliL family protein [Treponema sp.]